MAAVNGEALRILRERTGWSIQDLAAEVGISANYLGDIERSDRHNLKRNPGLLKRIAVALNVPVSMIEIRGEPEEVAS